MQHSYDFSNVNHQYTFRPLDVNTLIIGIIMLIITLFVFVSIDLLCQQTASRDIDAEMTQRENDTVTRLRIEHDKAYIVRLNVIGSARFLRIIKKIAKKT